MATAYVIQHTAVGPHFQGEVVEFPSEVDTDRLLALGAIRKATKDDGDPVQYGTSTDDLLQPFPAVPFDPTNPAGPGALPQGEPANAAAAIEARENAAKDAKK